MTRLEQEAVTRREEGSREGTVSEHPAFGQICASRTHGGQFALYGSDFRHDATIEIRISRSELHRDLARDWHHSRDEIISVRLSEAQWATFVSSLNIGGGVPCTVEHIQGERMPYVMLRNEREVVEKELDERIKRVADHLNAAIKDISDQTTGLSKIKRDLIIERVRRAQREVADSMPFAAKSFSEHMEATIEKAKMEVHAYIQSKVMHVGLKELGGETILKLSE